MTKKQELLNDMKEELKELPESVSMTSKYDAIKVHNVLDKFKQLTPRASKVLGKYLVGSEVTTINYEDFDSVQDYYLYLLRNYSKIKQSLQEIVESVEQKVA